MGRYRCQIVATTLLALVSVAGSFRCNNTLIADIALVEQMSQSVINKQVLNLAITSPGAGQVTLSWSALTGAQGYHIYYSTVAGESLSGARESGVPTNTFTFTGLTSAVTYYFSVTAYDDFGESAASTEISFTIP